MRNVRCSGPRCIALFSLFTLQGMCMTGLLRAACYSTPRRAIDALVGGFSFSPAVNNDGYQVTRIELDAVLGRRWAMISHCDHPEWPVFALPVNGAISLASPQEMERSATGRFRTAPVVRAGDIVRLWSQEGVLRIEVAGVSEESGGLGKTIRVRLLRRNTDDQSIRKQFSGVIRGPLDVEMQPR
jgi:hypothetical protein